MIGLQREVIGSPIERDQHVGRYAEKVENVRVGHKGGSGSLPVIRRDGVQSGSVSVDILP